MGATQGTGGAVTGSGPRPASRTVLDLKPPSAPGPKQALGTREQGGQGVAWVRGCRGRLRGSASPLAWGQGTPANFLKCPTLCSQTLSLGASLGDSVLGPAPRWHSPLHPGPALGLGCLVLTLKLIAIHPISPPRVLGGPEVEQGGPDNLGVTTARGTPSSLVQAGYQAWHAQAGVGRTLLWGPPGSQRQPLGVEMEGSGPGGELAVPQPGRGRESPGGGVSAQEVPEACPAGAGSEEAPQEGVTEV